VTTFYGVADNLATTTPGYNPGAGSLSLAPGAGASFAGVTFPILVSTFLADGTPVGVYSCTGRTGDTLTGLALLAGADGLLPAGSPVQLRWTREHVDQITGAITGLESLVLAPRAPGLFLASPVAGSQAAPSWRAIALSDLPAGSGGVGAGVFSTPGREDVRDHLTPPYGGIGNATVTRQAIQAAIDAAFAAGKPTVWLEPGIDWWADRGISLDRTGIALRGEGSTLKFTAATDVGVVMGIPRAGLTTAHYILNPHNDGSAHTRYGLALLGDSHVAQRSGGASGGVGRWAVPHLAVDLAYDDAAIVVANSECLCGWGSGSPSPLAVWARAGGPMVRFRCNDGQQYEFTIPKVGLGYHRYSFEVGADAATLLAFVDGLRVAPTNLSSNLAAWTPSAGRTLVDNDGTPFTIGSLSSFESGVTDFFGDPCHCTVYGLRLGVAPTYDGTVAIGGAQAFLPGVSSDPTLNQNNNFFQMVFGSRVVLTLQDDPATVTADRLVGIMSRDADGSTNAGFGFYLPNAGILPTTDCAVEGIDLSVNGPYGSPLVVGLALHSSVGGTRARRQLFTGGAYSILQYAFDSEYVLRIAHCELYGARSNIRLWEAIAYLDDLYLNAGDRGCLEFDGFCSAVVGKVFAAINQVTAKVIRGQGKMQLEYLNVDSEGPPSPTAAVIDWTTPTGAPQKGLLQWGHIVSSTIAAGAVLVDLHNQPDGSGSLTELDDGTVDLLGGPYAAVIRCNGASWRHRGAMVSSGVGVPAGTQFYSWTGPPPSPM
jgi:hypothetical protein